MLLVVTDPHELEAALQREWNDDTAAVYADLLTSRGDLHGELIAIDLALAKGITDALLERKRELLWAWIGAATIADAPWTLHHFRAGLLRRLRLPTTARFPLDALVDQMFGAVGARIAEIEIYGSNAELEAGIRALASRSLPWLTSLTVRRVGESRPIDQRVWAELVAATPHLRMLTLVGPSVAASPLHPAIAKLRSYGPTVVIAGEPVTSVTELDLRFETEVHRFSPASNPEALAALINPRAFPGLRRLDLSANAPPDREPANRAGVLVFLDSVEQLDRFERVRVPWIETADTAHELIAKLERCPHLTIEIARMYSALEVSHPRLVVPPPRQWPGGEHSRSALTVDIAPGVHCTELALSSLIEHLEVMFDAKRADQQQAWLEVWGFLDGLEWEDDQGNTIYKELAAATLLTALDALDGIDDRAANVADAIRGAKLAKTATVTVSRYWGW